MFTHFPIQVSGLWCPLMTQLCKSHSDLQTRQQRNQNCETVHGASDDSAIRTSGTIHACPFPWKLLLVTPKISPANLWSRIQMHLDIFEQKTAPATLNRGIQPRVVNALFLPSVTSHDSDISAIWQVAQNCLHNFFHEFLPAGNHKAWNFQNDEPLPWCYDASVKWDILRAVWAKTSVERT